jgi:hypothetical protein
VFRFQAFADESRQSSIVFSDQYSHSSEPQARRPAAIQCRNRHTDRAVTTVIEGRDGLAGEH